jgi:hypothetical protein
MKFRYSADESFDIGRDSARRQAGAQLTGRIIEKVVVDLAGQTDRSRDGICQSMLCHGRL